jgi:hypothetical protein
MKIFLFAAVYLGIAMVCNGQAKPLLSEVIEQVSDRWKSDSNSCKGHRRLVAKNISQSKMDSISKEQLFLNLGKPNSIQKFSSGEGITRRNYVGYIYFVYKDECPKIRLDGYAIQFVFDESETRLIEITGIEYCG